MRTMTKIMLALLLTALACPAQAALALFACEPEWGALAIELGGADVSVFVATTAKQDPHQIQARPSLIARLRGADLLFCTGAALEIGWLPVLLRQAANSRVQPGALGYLEAAGQVRLLEVPTRLDRSGGDVHAAGNPHIQTSPDNIRVVAVALAARLKQLDPSHAQGYTQREQAFLQRWDAAMPRWAAKAAPLKGVNVIAYHKGWAYLEAWLGLNEVGTIEPKPGVPPGSAYLAELLESIPRRQARLVLFAAYQDPKPALFVAEKAGIGSAMLPFTVGGTDGAGDLFALFDDTLDRLLAALEGRRG